MRNSEGKRHRDDGANRRDYGAVSAGGGDSWAFQRQLGWVFEKGLNTADPKSILFSPDELLALFETIHVDLNAMVVSFRAFHSQWEPTLGSLEKSGRFLPRE